MSFTRMLSYIRGCHDRNKQKKKDFINSKRHKNVKTRSINELDFDIHTGELLSPDKRMNIEPVEQPSKPNPKRLSVSLRRKNRNPPKVEQLTPKEPKHHDSNQHRHHHNNHHHNHHNHDLVHRHSLPPATEQDPRNSINVVGSSDYNNNYRKSTGTPMSPQLLQDYNNYTYQSNDRINSNGSQLSVASPSRKRTHSSSNSHENSNALRASIISVPNSPSLSQIAGGFQSVGKIINPSHIISKLKQKDEMTVVTRGMIMNIQTPPPRQSTDLNESIRSRRAVSLIVNKDKDTPSVSRRNTYGGSYSHISSNKYNKDPAMYPIESAIETETTNDNGVQTTSNIPHIDYNYLSLPVSLKHHHSDSIYSNNTYGDLESISHAKTHITLGKHNGSSSISANSFMEELINVNSNSVKNYRIEIDTCPSFT